MIFSIIEHIKLDFPPKFCITLPRKHPDTNILMDDKESKTLIRGLKEGKRESYRQLFRLYYATFRRFVEKIVGCRDSAEDIVQDVFIKIFINREQLKEDLSIESWLYVLCKNAALNHLRRQKHTIALEADDMIYSGLECDDDLYAKEIRRIVMQQFVEMPDKRREVFRLSRFEGKTNKEISTEMDISEKTVERHITLALSKLRKDLHN